MSNDTKAIIATVVAIGGLVLGQGFYLNARIDDSNTRIDDVHRRIDDLRGEMNRRLDDVQSDLRELRALVIDALKPADPAD